MRDEILPFAPHRFPAGGAKRRASLGLTAGAASALGVLAGCGGDSGGGTGTGTGTGTGGGTGTLADGVFTGTAGNNSINEVSLGSNLMAVDAGAGNDTVNTGEGAQTITGGEGDDTIDGGGGLDTAVFAGGVAGYHVTATLAGGSVSFTVDDSAADAHGDDGTDTLSGIEMLRFGSDTFAVVEHDATGRTGADSEIIYGDAMANGDGTNPVDGGAGDDLLFGFGGADVLVGGAGHDRIFGGADNDTLTGGAGDDTIDGGAGEEDVAVYSDVRSEYLVWRVGGAGDDPERFFVLHRTDAAGNDGRDTLTNVEMIQFGATDAVALNEDLASDAAGIVVADNAPTGSSELMAGATITAIDVSEWFASAGPNATYSVMGGLPEGVTFEGNMLGGVAPAETATITIVASNVDDETFDDVSHEYVINVAVAAPDTVLDAMDNIHVDPNMSGMEDAVIAGLAGDDVITGGVGDDTIFGNSTTVLGEDGESDTAVYEGVLAGYAISVDLRAFNSSPETPNVPRITVRDTATGSGAVDEGTDRLVGIEVVRFANATDDDDMDDVNLMVVRGNTDRTLTADVDEIVIGLATADGTDAASALMGGVGDDFVFGLGGDDFLSGGGGDDTISGGAGDDTIDGGEGMDTAVYAGARDDYRIWHTGTDADRMFHILDKDSATNGDGGRDTLCNVEMVRFGDSEAMALDATLADDGAPLTRASNAPVMRENPVIIEGTARIDVSGWFSSTAGVTYTATVSMGAASVTGSTVTFTAPDTAGTVTLTVTASDDAGDYDNISHGHVITVIAASTTPSAGNDFLTGDPDGGELAGMAGNDTFTGGAGNDMLYGNTMDALGADADVDTAVYFGELDDYVITAALSGTVGSDTNVPQITVMDGETTDDGDDDTVDDEGTDTLTDFDALRFDGGTAPVTLMIVDEGTSATEILLGDETANMMLTGLGGDDFIFGFGMDDVITGGAGDDIIDGGMGADTAAFAGAVEGYWVSATRSGANGTPVTFTVTDSDAEADGDDGTDTLTSIETLRFGTAAMSVVESNADPRTAADAEIIVGDNTMPDGETGGGMALDGGGGDDLMFGFGGDDFLSGGAGDDVVDGGAGDDTAVFAGGREGYTVSAALAGDVLELTVEDTATDNDMEMATVDDEGTDTLIGVETIRFGMVDIAVVRPDTADGDRNAADAEILAGDDTENGTASDRFDGGDGDDTIFGLGGDDHLEGGLGNDTIYGGEGTDTVYFMGERDDYRIWQAGSGATQMTFVQDLNTTENGGYEGRTTLVGVEMAVFGSATAVAVDTALVGSDTAPPDSPMLTGMEEEYVRFAADMTTDVSGWFSSTASDTTYSIENTEFMINDMGVVTHPADLTAWTTIEITASVVDNADYDDVRHTVTFTLPSYMGTSGNETADLSSVGDFLTAVDAGDGDDTIATGAGNQTITGGGGMDTIDGGAGTGDVAVFAGVVGDYSIGATLTGGEVTFTVEDGDSTADGDDGTDSLTNIETLRFDGGGAMLSLMSVTTGTDMNEILLGGDTANENLEGMDGNDWIFGFAMDDVITGGEGDDVIDGGAGDDTAVFAGSLNDFRITVAQSGTDATFTVEDIDASDDGDEGTDELSNFENLRFGSTTFAVVDHNSLIAADAQIILGDDTQQGRAAESRFEAGDEVDVVFGFGDDDFIDGGAGDDIISGGAGNDNIDGGGGRDTAVFEGALSGYRITVPESGDRRIIVTDINTDDVDEGMDVLSNIELLLFDGITLHVYNTDTELSTVNVRTYFDSRNDIYIDYTNYGSAFDGERQHGWAGDDLMFGRDGTDHQRGGEGDDFLDGGSGNDYSYFERGRDDYLIWQEMVTIGVETLTYTYVQDKGTRYGRDTLINVENVIFNNGQNVNLATGLSEITFDTAPPEAATVADGAPETLPHVAGTPVNASGWFEIPTAGNPSVKYSISETGLMSGETTEFMIDETSGQITVPGTLDEAATVIVTVSVVDNATFDDVSRTVMFTLPSPSRTVDFPNEEDGSDMSGDQAADPADGFEQVGPEERDDFESVTPLTGDADYFGL